MYPKLKINVYFIFLNIGDLTFGITLVSANENFKRVKMELSEVLCVVSKF
jgi:hypothetical protein